MILLLGYFDLNVEFFLEFKSYDKLIAGQKYTLFSGWFERFSVK